MPISYTFDRERSLILTDVAGELTMSETLKYFNKLRSDPDCPQAAIEVVDFTNVTDFSLQYSEMVTITGRYQSTKSGHNISATVFHCPTKISYGIGRMLHALHNLENPQHIVELSSTEEEKIQIIDRLRAI